ncbi:hypothetical protein [uncultured Eubacterium sp.]|uniref:hypothetical protein n=1 Tax=uncultured Eubacterium sp. TaxID=165185 RepID=UPI0025D6C30A|nr:hypothetical protein [uncultured Eubacterium sp.]
MSNKKLYKEAMSGIRHSDKAVERIFDMTIDKKKSRTGLIFKRLASATLALAVLIGGGFGANAIVQSNKKAEQPFEIMIAYADDQYFKIGSSSKKYNLVKGVYFAPADNEKMCRKQREKAQKDFEQYRLTIEEWGKINEPYSTSGVGEYDIYDDNGNVTTKLYTSSAGSIVADVTDYSNVKSFTVENESPDGILQFEYNKSQDLYESQKPKDIDEENPYAPFINNKFTLTGDELRESQKEWGHFGYFLEWKSVGEVFEWYRCDKNFKAKDIKDKITFTFEYNDGSIESTSVNISFDNYGHMIMS